MPQPNQEKLDAFLGKMVGDLGAIATGAGVVLGDRLGLFKAMSEGGKMTAAELAGRTGTQERLVREWLSAQAAAGYIEYDEASERFHLNPEQELVFARRGQPGLHGRRLRGSVRPVDRRGEGEPGVPLRKRHGLARAQRLPVPRHGAVLPAGLQCQPGRGLAARARRRGGEARSAAPRWRMSDAAMAPRPCSWRKPSRNRASSASTIMRPSIERARAAAEEAGVAGNTQFEVAPAKAYPGTYDLVGLLRLPARHGRPARGGRACPPVAEDRRHLDDRRAVRARPSVGQPQSRSAASTMPLRPSSARRPRCRRRWGWGSAPRPARRSCARW